MMRNCAFWRFLWAIALVCVGEWTAHAAPSSQPSSAPANGFTIDWPEDQGESLSFFLIGSSESTPRVIVRDLLFENSESSSLSDDAKKKAIASIQGQVSVEPVGFLRFWKLYRVSLQNRTVAVNEAVHLIQSVDLDVTGVEVRENNQSNPIRNAQWGYGAVLDELVKNAADAPHLVEASAPASAELEETHWSPKDLPTGEAKFSLSVAHDGFMRLLPEHLRQVGIDPRQVDPARLSLISHGAEVPCFRIDDGDGEFENGESILFYGQQSESEFSTGRTYWLVVDAKGAKGPAPLKALDGISDDVWIHPWHMLRREIEEDSFSVHEEGNFLEITEVRWVWKTLTGDRPTSFTFSLPDMAEMDELSPATVPITLDFFHLSEASANLPPNTLPISQRKVRARLNGHEIGEMIFADHQDKQKKLEVPLEYLKADENLLTLDLSALQEGPETGDLSEGTYLDKLTLDYPARVELSNGRLRMHLGDTSAGSSQGWIFDAPANGNLAAFDITQTDNVSIVEMHRQDAGLLLAPPPGPPRSLEVVDADQCTSAPLLRRWSASTIRDTSNEADYLIISHPKFEPLLKPLIDQRTREGMIVRTAVTDEIYDEFSFGELTPYAIKNFLLYTLRHWKTAPTYVLLVGDCTGDYRNALRVDVENLVPGFRKKPDGEFGQDWVSDHWYGTLIGDDDLPDVIVGRIAVTSVEDAEEVIRKQAQASQTAAPGPWRNRLLFVADNETGFPEACEDLRAEQTPKGYFTKRIYIGQMPWERNFYLEKKDVEADNLKVSGASTQAILDTLNAGVSFLLFCGHGAPNIWTDERIWFGMNSPNSDALLLRNQDKLPFMMNLTCNTGAIDYPKPPYNICITEEMMRVKQGGLLSAYVPSGPGTTPEHLEFAKAIMPPILSGAIRRQGDAILLGKVRHLLGKTANLNYPRMYILLGDPALSFPVPQESCTPVIKPETIDLRSKPSTVSVSLEGLSFNSGNAVFQFIGPEGHESDLPETKPMAFNERRQTFAVELPKKMIPGKWRLAAYAWNAELKKDAHGQTEIPVDMPRAEIADFRLLPEKGRPRIELTLRNPSILPLSNASFEIGLKSGTQFSRIGGGSLDLAPGGEQSWTMDWKPEVGLLHELRATLLNYLDSPDTKTTPPTRVDLAWATPDTKGEPAFAMTETGLQREIRTLNPTVESEIRVPIYRTSGAYAGPLEIGYGWGDEISTTQTLTMAQGQPKAEFVFNLSTAPEGLPRPFKVQIDPSGKVIKQDSPPHLTSTLDLKALPDLQFVRDGLTVEPNDPSDSRTVLFRLAVRNNGRSDAGAFRVSAYDDDPTSGGMELESAVVNAMNNVPGLAAGKQTEVVIRWDPKSNAGENKIFFKIDSMDQVVESNEKNNIGTKMLRVRTLAKLEPVSFEFDNSELLRFRRVRVKAGVRNSGETEARNVMISFYAQREPDPAHHKGDKFIPVIRPGETRYETYEWDLPENFRQMVEDALANKVPAEKVRIDGCAQIYLRGSLQRVLLAPASATRTQ